MKVGYRRTVIVTLGVCFFVVMPIAAMDRIQQVEQQLLCRMENTIKFINNLLAYLSYYYVDVHKKDSLSWTPLHYAAYWDRIRGIVLLLQRKANIEAIDERGMTPLHWAAYENNIRAINILLNKGANIHSRTNGGSTPLHIAAERNAIKSIAQLLERGADIESKTTLGQMQETPLDTAVRYEHVAATMLLLERGATNRDRTDGSTLSHKAVNIGSTGLMELLLSTNASAALESKDVDGRTFLYYALEKLNSQDADIRYKVQQILDIVVKNKRYYINTSVRPTTLLGLTALYLLKKSRERNNLCMYDYVYTAQQIATQLHDERANLFLQALKNAGTPEVQKQKARAYLKYYIERNPEREEEANMLRERIQQQEHKKPSLIDAVS